MKRTQLQQAFEAFVGAPHTVGAMLKMTDAIRHNDRLLARCLDALNEEALAADNWQRNAEKCPAWYELRALLREQLCIPKQKGKR